MKIAKAVKIICFAICIGIAALVLFSLIYYTINGFYFMGVYNPPGFETAFFGALMLAYVFAPVLFVFLVIAIIASVVESKLIKEKEEGIRARANLVRQDAEYQNKLIEKYCGKEDEPEATETPAQDN